MSSSSSSYREKLGSHKAHINTHTHTHVYQQHICMCLCICAQVLRAHKQNELFHCCLFVCICFKQFSSVRQRRAGVK